MDSLDTVDKVMAFEEVFGVDLPDPSPETFRSPDELVDWLAVPLANLRPNKAAQKWLRKLATEQQRPDLADGLDGPWRCDQIDAIVPEIFR